MPSFKFKLYSGEIVVIVSENYQNAYDECMRRYKGFTDSGSADKDDREIGDGKPYYGDYSD